MIDSWLLMLRHISLYIDKQGCISCEEFESKLQSQQREIESLQNQLNYWQNTTINILEKYPMDGEQVLYIATFWTLYIIYF